MLLFISLARQDRQLEARFGKQSSLGWPDGAGRAHSSALSRPRPAGANTARVCYKFTDPIGLAGWQKLALDGRLATGRHSQIPLQSQRKPGEPR